MFYSLEKLRGKPESFRRKILLVLTIGITLIIFFSWMFFTEGFFPSKVVNEDPSFSNPFSLIKDGTLNIYDEVNNKVGNFKKDNILQTP